MKTQSAKAKGRKLQQQVRNTLVEELKIHPEDIESRSMGASGEDLIMSRIARQRFPYSIECKNQERVNIWSAYEQASENSGEYEPLVILKKNRAKTLCLIDFDAFVKLHEWKHQPIQSLQNIKIYPSESER